MSVSKNLSHKSENESIYSVFYPYSTLSKISDIKSILDLIDCQLYLPTDFGIEIPKTTIRLDFLEQDMLNYAKSISGIIENKSIVLIQKNYLKYNNINYDIKDFASNYLPPKSVVEFPSSNDYAKAMAKMAQNTKDPILLLKTFAFLVYSGGKYGFFEVNSLPFTISTIAKNVEDDFILEAVSLHLDNETEKYLGWNQLTEIQKTEFTNQKEQSKLLFDAFNIVSQN